MKKYTSKILVLCITALLMTTSCGREDVAPASLEALADSAQPSFDQTAIQLAEVLQIAFENNWFEQSELISRLFKPGTVHSPAEIELIETNLGIPYFEFNRLISELGNAAGMYARSLSAMNLTDEELSDKIHNAVSSSSELQLLITMDFAEGRCFLQDACYLIGGIITQAYLFFCNLFTNIFCEEEVLPLYILIQEICEMFAC